MLKLLGGIIALSLGVYLLFNNIKETKRGYRSKYGNDIGLYFGSAMLIMIGLTLIIRTFS